MGDVAATSDLDACLRPIASAGKALNLSTARRSLSRALLEFSRNLRIKSSVEGESESNSKACMTSL